MKADECVFITHQCKVCPSSKPTYFPAYLKIHLPHQTQNSGVDRCWQMLLLSRLDGKLAPSHHNHHLI